MFITFEGGEGTGKSTQVKLLAERLRAQGKVVVTTREPGGTPEAEALRDLLVSGESSRWSSEAEVLLNYAARDSHLRVLIRPALAASKIVICDRFMDSTRAYQGFAGDCPMSIIDQLETSIVKSSRPDLTLIFDLDPTIGIQRSNEKLAGLMDISLSRYQLAHETEFEPVLTEAQHYEKMAQESRFERKGIAFHQHLREGFLAIAKSEPDRCKVIDASQNIDAVAKQIWHAVHG